MPAWDDLELSVVNSLVASMPRRIQQLAEKEGYRLDY
jgi:hypothetical protein